MANILEYLDYVGLARLVSKFKAMIPTKVSQLQNDSSYVSDKPLLSATYTGLYYGANGTNNGYFEPITVKPKDANNVIGLYYIRFRATTTSTAYPSYKNCSEVEMWFNRTGSVNCYRIWNWRVGSYLHRYISLCYPSTNANFVTYGTHIGVGITEGNNYNNASYKRDTLIEIMAVSPDLVVSLDKPEDTKQYTLMSWYNATNINNHTTLEGQSVGLQETGDANNVDRLQLNGSRFLVNAKYRVHGYSIVGFTSDNLVLPISVRGTDKTTTAYTISNGTRIFNTDLGFDWTKGLMYVNSSTNTAVNGTTPNSVMYQAIPSVDMRYSDNSIASNAAANTLGFEDFKPVYLRGVIKDDGLFYIRPSVVTYSGNTYYRAFTQTIPAEAEYDEEGYRIVYWQFGYAYYNTSYATRGYQATLSCENPMFEVRDGNLVPYHPNRLPTTYTPAATSPTPSSSTAPSGDASPDLPLANESLAPAPEDTHTVAIAKLHSAFLDNETVIIEALRDLRAYIGRVEDKGANLSEFYLTSTATGEDLALKAGDSYEMALAKLEKATIENETILARALVGLDTRIRKLESKTS